MTTIDATVRCEDYVHWRPSLIIKQVCDFFSDTSFTIERAPEVNETVRVVDPKQLLKLGLAHIGNGEAVHISTQGTSEQLAALFLKGILENLGSIYRNDGTASRDPVKESVYGLLSDIAIANPDRQQNEAIARLEKWYRDDGESTDRTPLGKSCTTEVELPVNLHGAIVEVLPRIARHFVCSMWLIYDHPHKGRQRFNLSRDNSDLKFQILTKSPAAGTLLTVKTFGERCEELCGYMSELLRKLPQVDSWIRTCFLDRRSDSDIVEGIRDILKGKTHRPVVSRNEGTKRDCKISDILIRELVTINREEDTREGAVSDLTRLAAGYAGLDFASLRDLVDVWNKQINVGRAGFAFLHTRAENCPLITLVFGVYPQGIEWPRQSDRKYALALIVAAIDAPNLYLGYMTRLLRVLEDGGVSLVQELVAADSPARVLQALKKADIHTQHLLEAERATNKRRLLIVESLEDEITAARHEILLASPRLRDFDLEYVYAVEHDPSRDDTLNKAEFAERLRTRIAESMPHCVLFHTGHVFMRHMRWFEDMISHMRERFRDVRFGYQQKRDLPISRGVFSEDAETKRIQTLLFETILGV